MNRTGDIKEYMSVAFLFWRSCVFSKKKGKHLKQIFYTQKHTHMQTDTLKYACALELCVIFKSFPRPQNDQSHLTSINLKTGSAPV